MAKKEKNTGLGRGLDSLIPKIEETEVEEGISLEDLLRESEDESKTFEELVEEFEEEFEGEDDLQVLEKSADDEEEKQKDSSEYTNVFFNDDEKVEEDGAKDEEKISSEKSVENIESAVNLNEETDATSEIIEASDDLKEVGSLLSSWPGRGVLVPSSLVQPRLAPHPVHPPPCPCVHVLLTRPPAHTSQGRRAAGLGCGPGSWFLTPWAPRGPGA